METETPVKKAAKSKRTVSKKKKSDADVSASYNKFKEFDGKAYTGMKIGRNHKWYYDKGEWRETKLTPDFWTISYAVTKRRAGKAPEGSGAAVGTGYHWYIVAHQNVKKLNADDYSTSMSGFKFKLAHKRADNDKWSATIPTQRKRLISFLKEMIAQLEMEPLKIQMDYQGKKLKLEALPVMESLHDGVYDEFEITLNDEYLGVIRRMKNNWKMELMKDQKLVDAIGEQLSLL